jgi:hypothetical protein
LALTDCAPDRWGRTLITRREAALARGERRTARALGELDYRLGVRDDLRQGALRFATTGSCMSEATCGGLRRPSISTRPLLPGRSSTPR